MIFFCLFPGWVYSDCASQAEKARTLVGHSVPIKERWQEKKKKKKLLLFVCFFNVDFLVCSSQSQCCLKHRSKQIISEIQQEDLLVLCKAEFYRFHLERELFFLTCSEPCTSSSVPELQKRVWVSHSIRLYSIMLHIYFPLVHVLAPNYHDIEEIQKQSVFGPINSLCRLFKCTLAKLFNIYFSSLKYLFLSPSKKKKIYPRSFLSVIFFFWKCVYLKGLALFQVMSAFSTDY